MAAILGDVRLNGGQFCNLMAPGSTDGVAHVQPALAMATRLGDQIHRLIRTLGGNQRARMPGMSRLPTGLSSTLRAATAVALAAGETIRRWRLRGRRRILLTQGQLAFEIGDVFLRVRDPLLGFRELPLAFRQFATEPIILSLRPLLCARVAWPLCLRHASHGTPIGSICTAP